MSEKLRHPQHKQNKPGIWSEDLEIEACENCVLATGGYDPFEFRGPDDDEYDMCHEWDGWEFDFTYNEEDDPDHCDEPLHGFSWQQCDLCHSYLGGEKWTLKGVYYG